MATKLLAAKSAASNIYQLLPSALWGLNVASVSLIIAIDLFDLPVLLLAVIIIIHGLLTLVIFSRSDP